MEERKEKKRKERSTQHRRSTAQKNPSWENFLKRMNSIYHTDGTLRVSERQKKIGRVREMRTDTGRYISRDAVGKKRGEDGVVKRSDNAVREDEEDEVSISERSIHHKHAVYFGARSRSLIALPLPTLFSGPISCVIFPRRFARSILKSKFKSFHFSRLLDYRCLSSRHYHQPVSAGEVEDLKSSLKGKLS